MKKKQPQNIVDESNPVIDVKAIIRENSFFFDKLIELIPAKFYLPIDDSDKKWFQGLSKGEKALAKKETRENVKKARRDRLDPEKSSTSTLDLLMKNLEKEKANDESDDEEEVEINPMMSGLQEDGDKSATYEELRQRLHRKIEELRGGRNAGGSDKTKKKDEKKGMQQKKRKRESELDEKKPTWQGQSMEKMDMDMAQAAKELKFSHVKLGTEEHGKRKKKKLSKLKELEKAKQLEESMKDPEKGERIAKKHSWKAATDRAAGIKVHDDPKLVRQSLKKEKKRQEKNAEKWKERVQTQQKMRAEKQQKRSHNIADRIHKKKMKKIAKREKKLLRPGFEGRKEGYVNETSNDGATT